MILATLPGSDVILKSSACAVMTVMADNMARTKLFISLKCPKHPRVPKYTLFREKHRRVPFLLLGHGGFQINMALDIALGIDEPQTGYRPLVQHPLHPGSDDPVGQSTVLPITAGRRKSFVPKL